jgi:hypothetical protein
MKISNKRFGQIPLVSKNFHPYLCSPILPSFVGLLPYFDLPDILAFPD